MKYYFKTQYWCCMTGLQNCRCLVTMATKFCVVAPSICGSSIWDLLHVTILWPRILWWLVAFLKFLHLYFMVACQKDCRLDM